MPRSRSQVLLRFAALTATLLAASRSAAAQTTLFYNGDPDYFNAWTAEQRTIVPGYTIDARGYDDFTVSGSAWTVTGLIGSLQGRRSSTFDPGHVSWSQAYWEIRSGVSAGNGGTLLFSGTDATTLTLLAAPAYSETTYRTVVDGFTPFVLQPGTYWMTISPYPVGEDDAMAAIWTTGGANGVNAQIDGHVYLDSPSFGMDFEPLALRPNPAFSYGVIGTTATPEPATLGLTALGIGTLAAITRRRRHRLGRA